MSVMLFVCGSVYYIDNTLIMSDEKKNPTNIESSKLLKIFFYTKGLST